MAARWSQSLKTYFTHTSTFLLALVAITTAQTQPPSWRDRPASTSVREGGNVTLKCHVTSSTNVIWKRGGLILFLNRDRWNADPRLTVTGSGFDFDLNIQNVKLEDNGAYTCSVQGLQDAEATITVLVEPSDPTIQSDNVETSKEKDVVHFNCSSNRGNPPPTITWLRDQLPISEGISYKAAETLGGVTYSVLQWTLTRSDHNKRFECRVENQANQNSPKVASISAKVQYAPYVTFSPFSGKYSVLENEDVQITCEVDANPQVSSVEWFVKGQLIGAENLTTIVGSHEGNTSTVRNFRPVRKEDSGLHLCAARNIIGSHNSSVLLDVQYPPKINTGIPNDRLVVNESSPLNLMCQVDANPQASIVEWRRNNTQLVARQAYSLSKVTRAHKGIYTCVANNTLKLSGRSEEVKSVKHNVEVVVQYLPGNATIDPHPMVVIGDMIKLKCRVSDPGVPTAVFEWVKQGITGPIHQGDEYNIAQATLSDNGKYNCTPKNILGYGKSQSIQLEVNEKPKFLRQLQSNEVFVEGELSRRFMCSAQGKPEPKIEWFKNGQPISDSDPFYTITAVTQPIQVYSFNRTSLLEFRGTERAKGIRMEDTANYTCLVSNPPLQGKKLSSSVSLLVRFAPQLSETNTKVAVDMNSTATLSCRAKAYPDPNFEWYRNGKPIIADNQLVTIQPPDIITQGLFASILRIQRVTGNDLGDYICNVKNDIGNRTAVINLSVRRKPDPPKDLSINGSSWESVYLKWTPGFDGGYPQNFSVIVTRPDNEKNWLHVGSKNSHNVTGLFPSTQYKFQVYGLNILGAGQYSSQVAIMTSAKYIPTPVDVEFDAVKGILTLKTSAKNLCIRIEKLASEKDNKEVWKEHVSCAPPIVDQNTEIKIEDVGGVAAFRVALCLQERPDVCGSFERVNMTKVGESSSDVPQETIFIVAGVCGGILLILIIVLIIVCCTRRRTNKKNYENETPHSRRNVPLTNANPDRLRGYDNPTLNDSMDMVDFDDPSRGGVFATENKTYDPSHGMNGGLNYNSLDKRNNHPNGHVHQSGNSSPDSWVKPPQINGGLSPDTSYDFQNELNGGYINEDEMNRRNREKSDKLPPLFINPNKPDGHRSGNESGYSTPDPNKPKKVIYEVIV